MTDEQLNRANAIKIKKRAINRTLKMLIKCKWESGQWVYENKDFPDSIKIHGGENDALTINANGSFKTTIGSDGVSESEPVNTIAGASKLLISTIRDHLETELEKLQKEYDAL